jgi:hypothetical protein
MSQSSVWPVLTLVVRYFLLQAHNPPDLYRLKGKAVPLQAWSGPEGSRKLRFPDFMATAQDERKVVSLTHRLHLPSGNTPRTHFCWGPGVS